MKMSGVTMIAYMYIVSEFSSELSNSLVVET